jgi:threonine synthase
LAPTYRGCPQCREDGVPVNFVAESRAEALRSILGRPPERRFTGLWRFAAALPVSVDWAVSLGEGDTPLLALPRLGRECGVPGLYVKNESTNPTWSHKDRLSAVTVTAAAQAGARVVAAASTGNHGASLAAYAARAGLRCVVLTVATVPDTMKVLMQSYGAHVVAVTTSAERYVLLTAGVDDHGWYPASNTGVPPVGSSPYGVEGYKTIAYELWEQLGGRVPDWMVIPVAHGDCLSGISRGFEDLRAIGAIDAVPRLVGAEVFGALEGAVSSQARALGPVATHPTAAFSIGGAYSTFQSVRAIDSTNGRTCTVSEEALRAMQLRLGAAEGLYAEAASCVALTAAEQLARENVIAADESVVCLLTSTGLKDPGTTVERLPPVPVIEPSFQALRAVLAEQAASSGRDDAELFDLAAPA